MGTEHKGTASWELAIVTGALKLGFLSHATCMTITQGMVTQLSPTSLQCYQQFRGIFGYSLQIETCQKITLVKVSNKEKAMVIPKLLQIFYTMEFMPFIMSKMV